MKKKLAFIIFLIYLFSFIFANAVEKTYEIDMTLDGTPHGVELIDSEEGVIVKMAAE